jgi:hypothetical protein
MSLYSAIQFTSVSFLYASASNLGDFQVSDTIFPLPAFCTDQHFQFLFIDVLIILPIAIFSELNTGGQRRARIF